MNEPYFLEVDENGCAHCGAGRTWTIICPDGASVGQSWGADPDDPSEPCEAAVDMCDAMNRAFYVGRGDREGHIGEMVNRFLSWTLPADFAPDGGVTFEPPSCWPTGTNLLTAEQARAMLEHVLAVEAPAT